MEILGQVHTKPSFLQLEQVANNGNVDIEDFYNGKKVTSNRAQPDDHWIKILILILLSKPGICTCKSETFRSL